MTILYILGVLFIIRVVWFAIYVASDDYTIDSRLDSLR